MGLRVHCVVLAIALASIVVVAQPSATRAGEARPVGWRRDTSGSFPDALPPTEWSDKQHVSWKAKLPGGSNSSPVIVGDKVLVTSEPDRLTCLAADDGGKLWEVQNGFDRVLTAAQFAVAKQDHETAHGIRKRIDAVHKQIEELERRRKDAPEDAELKAERKALDKQVESARAELPPLEKYAIPQKSAGCSTATPLCDGKFVYVLYGTGIAACYDLDGNPQWIKLFDKPETDWGHTASPLLVGDLLIVHFTDMVALDHRTGQVRWKTEIKPNYGSPISVGLDGGDVIVTAGGDVVRAVDGRLLTKKIAEPLSRCSPVVRDRTVYFMQSKAEAVELPQSISENLETKSLWKTNLTSENYFASPLWHDGLIYTVSENRVLTVLDATNGEEVYLERLRFKTRAPVVSSLSATGDYVFITNEQGSTKVLRAGRSYAEVAENALEHLRSSLAFDGHRLFVRKSSNLYCIAKE